MVGVLAELGYRRLFVLERSLDGPLRAAEPAVPVSVGELESVEEYLGLRPDTERAEVERRLRAGGRCFVARLDSRPVSATWAYEGRAPVPFLAGEIAAGEDTVVLHDTLTTPELRGLGISPAVLTEIMRRFRPLGHRRIVTTVVPENHSSLRARSKTGFRAVGLAGYLGPAPLRWHFVRSFRRPREVGVG
jgi:GNAT superfamily N-acetyltransferase